MTVAARSKSALHVLDFGGAFGSSYMQHRKILSALRECSWTVVEQERIVACGKTEFSTEILSFQDTLEQGFSAKPINVVLLSSVLQYLENPYELLEKIAALAPSAIIIDRTPLALTGERIAIQHVPRSIYSASYPCRFLDKARLEAVMAPLGRLTPWFASQVDPVGFWGVMSYAGEDK